MYHAVVAGSPIFTTGFGCRDAVNSFLSAQMLQKDSDLSTNCGILKPHPPSPFGQASHSPGKGELGSSVCVRRTSCAAHTPANYTPPQNFRFGSPLPVGDGLGVRVGGGAGGTLDNAMLNFVQFLRLLPASLLGVRAKDVERRCSPHPTLPPSGRGVRCLSCSQNEDWQSCQDCQSCARGEGNK